jgi:hypothetical protein
MGGELENDIKEFRQPGITRGSPPHTENSSRENDRLKGKFKAPQKNTAAPVIPTRGSLRNPPEHHSPDPP